VTDSSCPACGEFEEAKLLIDRARARLGLGEHDGARQSATEAVDVARRQGAPVIETLALLTRARVSRATGARADVVAADLSAALALAQETGATASEAEIEAERAETPAASQ
jgi:hypothetical protein